MTNCKNGMAEKEKFLTYREILSGCIIMKNDMNSGLIMIKAKYLQLFLARQYEGMDIMGRYLEVVVV